MVVCALVSLGGGGVGHGKTKESPDGASRQASTAFLLIGVVVLASALCLLRVNE